MKRIICLMISLCSCINFCFAESDVTTFTLEESIEYGEKNNASLIDIERTTDKNEDAYEDAKKEYQKWKNKMRSGGYSFETVQEYLDAYGYGLEMATLSYDNFIASKEITKKSLDYSIINMAYKIKLMERNIETLENNIKKQENDVEIAKVKNKFNMLTSIEYDKTCNTLDTSRLELINLKNSLENLNIELKKIMGYDVLKKIEIKVPEYEFKILEVENVEELIEKSLATNNSAIKAKKEYKQKEINNMLAIKTHWLETKEDVRDAKEAFTDSEKRLSNEINSIKENLLLLYQEIKVNEEKTGLAKETYDRSKTQFEQAEVMYKLGMISKNDYLGYKVALLNEESKYKSAVTDNILLNERWKIAISVGDVIK